jgi:hypothetical protein
MALRLSELLDEPEVLIESAVKKLEHISGWESTDVRLLAEINAKVRAKLAELNLDPKDTTGPELYHALLAKLEQDEQKINMPYIKRLAAEIIAKIEQAHSPYSVYALKQSAAKDILRAHPPRRLMKHLNYRSAESMLKRENINALYAVLPTVESPRWLNVFWKDIAKLNPSDFETRNVALIGMPAKLPAAGSSISNVPLLGAVAIWDNNGSSIALAANITNHINELRAECAQIKLRNVEAGFGNNLVEIVQGKVEHPFKISHLPISWLSIFHHYGERPAAEHTEFFGPHLLHDDIKAHDVLESLTKIFPTLSWWRGLEHVAYKSGQGFVSMNLLDVAESQGMNFKERSLNHYRKSLWHEFVSRYFAHPSVEQHFMQQLEPQAIPVADIPSISNPEQEIKELMELGV